MSARVAGRGFARDAPKDLAVEQGIAAGAVGSMLPTRRLSRGVQARDGGIRLGAYFHPALKVLHGRGDL